MTYNIKITDNSPQAKSLLIMLQTFAMDYNFLQIEKEDEENNLSDKLKQELDFRYEHFLEHGNEYKDWEMLKHKYVQQ